MDILVDNERMNSIIEFWQKKYADAAKELEYSIKLRKQIQNDLLKSDRINDNLEAENTELKAENVKLKAQLDVLEEDNKKLSSENDALYNNSLQEVKEDLVKRVWNLQTENKELAHYLACMTEQRNKANTCLQEIKAIAEELLEKGLEPQSVEHQLRLKGKRELASIISDLITKAGEE